jgi:anti-sigma B factor antagonist
MAEPFLINASRHGPLARVELTGEVNRASAPLITNRVFWYLEMESVDEVVIEMAGVSVIDSGGISVLIGCKRRSLAMGKVLQVVASQSRVAQVLNLTGVDGYLAGSGGPEHAAG